MEDLDLYEDLDECYIEKDKEKKSGELQSLGEKYQNALLEIAKLEKKNARLEKKNKILLKNFDCLIATVRTELQRKESEIHGLRQEKDNMLFRRKNFARPGNVHSNSEDAPVLAGEACIDTTTNACKTDDNRLGSAEPQTDNRNLFRNPFRNPFKNPELSIPEKVAAKVDDKSMPDPRTYASKASERDVSLKRIVYDDGPSVERLEKSYTAIQELDHNKHVRTEVSRSEPEKENRSRRVRISESRSDRSKREERPARRRSRSRSPHRRAERAESSRSRGDRARGEDLRDVLRDRRDHDRQGRRESSLRSRSRSRDRERASASSRRGDEQRRKREKSEERIKKLLNQQKSLLQQLDDSESKRQATKEKKHDKHHKEEVKSKKKSPEKRQETVSTQDLLVCEELSSDCDFAGANFSLRVEDTSVEEEKGNGEAIEEGELRDESVEIVEEKSGSKMKAKEKVKSVEKDEKESEKIKNKLLKKENVKEKSVEKEKSVAKDEKDKNYEKLLEKIIDKSLKKAEEKERSVEKEIAEENPADKEKAAKNDEKVKNDSLKKNKSKEKSVEKEMVKEKSVEKEKGKETSVEKETTKEKSVKKDEKDKNEENSLDKIRATPLKKKATKESSVEKEKLQQTSFKKNKIKETPAKEKKVQKGNDKQNDTEKYTFDDELWQDAPDTTAESIDLYNDLDTSKDEGKNEKRTLEEDVARIFAGVSDDDSDFEWISPKKPEKVAKKPVVECIAEESRTSLISESPKSMFGTPNNAPVQFKTPKDTPTLKKLQNLFGESPDCSPVIGLSSLIKKFVDQEDSSLSMLAPLQKAKSNFQPDKYLSANFKCNLRTPLKKCIKSDEKTVDDVREDDTDLEFTPLRVRPGDFDEEEQILSLEEMADTRSVTSSVSKADTQSDDSIPASEFFTLMTQLRESQESGEEKFKKPNETPVKIASVEKSPAVRNSAKKSPAAVDPNTLSEQNKQRQNETPVKKSSVEKSPAVKNSARKSPAAVDPNTLSEQDKRLGTPKAKSDEGKPSTTPLRRSARKSATKQPPEVEDASKKNKSPGYVRNLLLNDLADEKPDLKIEKMPKNDTDDKKDEFKTPLKEAAPAKPQPRSILKRRPSMMLREQLHKADDTDDDKLVHEIWPKPTPEKKLTFKFDDKETLIEKNMKRKSDEFLQKQLDVINKVLQAKIEESSPISDSDEEQVKESAKKEGKRASVSMRGKITAKSPLLKRCAPPDLPAAPTFVRPPVPKRVCRKMTNVGLFSDEEEIRAARARQSLKSPVSPPNPLPARKSLSPNNSIFDTAASSPPLPELNLSDRQTRTINDEMMNMFKSPDRNLDSSNASEASVETSASRKNISTSASSYLVEPVSDTEVNVFLKRKRVKKKAPKAAA